MPDIRISFRFSLLLAFVLLGAASAGLAESTKHVRVWILSGQSNMGGGAPTSPYDNPPQPGDIWYRYSSAPDPGSDEWTPLGDVRSRGLESQFGERMAEAFPDDTIALLKCNRGGSVIRSWLPGGDLYASMLDRLDAMEQDLNQRVADGEISGWEYMGYLWMQGESDAANGASDIHGQLYLSNLELLVESMRKRLGNSQDLPFVFGRIYDFDLHQDFGMNRTPPEDTSWRSLLDVRYAQTLFPLMDVNAAMVDTDDLSMSLTEPHYHSYEEMGHRFAHAFMNLHEEIQRPFRPYQLRQDTDDRWVWHPAHLAATPGDAQVTIDWSHALHADSYSIHYGTSPDDLDQQVSGIDENQVVVAGLQNGLTYYFAGQSHNAAGDSPLTPVVSATPDGDQGMVPFVWTQDLKRTPVIGGDPDYVVDEYIAFLEENEVLSLNGTVRDDTPGVQAQWSVVSEPEAEAQVQFENATAIDTTATFDTPGYYKVRLTATDGVNSAHHDLKVKVYPDEPNSAPVTDTAPHPTMSVNDGGFLIGRMLNADRKPELSPLSYQWSLLEGPGQAIIDEPSDRRTKMEVDSPGIYRFQFTGGDGDLQAQDLLTVAVNPDGTANLASGKPHSQSSRGDEAGSSMANALNGDTFEADGYNGLFRSNPDKRLRTHREDQPWAGVNLEADRSIDFIRIWNPGRSEQLSNYHIYISPEPFASTNIQETIAQVNANGGWHGFVEDAAGWPEVIPINHSGQYLRIQLEGTKALQIKEFEVIGPSGPSVPSEVDAKEISHDAIRLSWTDASGETGYRIRRSLDPAGPWTVIVEDLPANDTTFTDTGLQELTEYFYEVAAYNAVAPSDWSSTVSAQTASALESPEILNPIIPMQLAGKAVAHDLDIVGGTPPYTVSLSFAPEGLTVTNEGVLGGVIPVGGTHVFEVIIRDSEGVEETYQMEVPVAARNFALSSHGAAAQQSSQLSGNTASRTIDDDTTTFGHTLKENHAWWQVDIGELVRVQQIEVHNREASVTRLTNFHIFASESPFGERSLDELSADPGIYEIHDPNQAVFPSLYPVGEDAVSARHFRVQLAGTDYLHIAEFRVLGSLPPEVPAQEPPSANQHHPYRTKLKAQLGHGRLVWSLAEGSPALPDGLTLDEDGFLQGDCTAEPGDYGFQIEVTDQAGQTAVGDVVLVVEPRLATLWRIHHFGDLSQAVEAAWTDDPDKDGKLNLAEYASFGHPHIPDSEPLASGTIENGNFTFSTIPLRDDPNISYVVEFSTDLIEWKSNETQYELQRIIPSPGSIRLVATDLQSVETLSRRFARLKIQIRD